MKSYDISGLNVLVLEKHLLIRNLLTEVFREFGVPSVHSTPEPKKAWKIFESFPVDIVFCDWCAELDGLAFLSRIRRDPETMNAYAPVVILTANTELRHVCEARDAGMTEFLAKPVSAQAIYERIVAVIESDRFFINSGEFFGPDRRRHHADHHDGKERRARTT
ncbi:MAG: response regulator [Rhodospirillaceae bacterium]|jgi:two-component system, chemotaxis family, chemotaxis protein CheY|nr:response regulator [Rhodospirillaceae bacterium]